MLLFSFTDVIRRLQLVVQCRVTAAWAVSQRDD
jgi:hypothetical protein